MFGHWHFLLAAHFLSFPRDFVPAYDVFGAFGEDVVFSYAKYTPSCVFHLLYSREDGKRTGQSLAECVGEAISLFVACLDRKPFSLVSFNMHLDQQYYQF